VTAPLVTFEVLTLFPEAFPGFLSASLLGKAQSTGLVAVHTTHIRDFGLGKHRSVDDAPYGGGPGMVMRPEPIADALEHVAAARGPAHRILLSPQGRLFDQAVARELAARPRVLFVCGRYEGVDERVATLCDDALSVGDYVLSGGEAAALVIIDAVVRLLPGVLGCADSAASDSFSLAEGRLEYPQYTRPPSWRGLEVPKVLQSGDHARIARARARASLRRTQARRPDLLLRHPLTDAARDIVEAAIEPEDEL